MMLESVVCVLLPLSFISNNAAKILAVFPIPSISHQVVFRPLTQELAKRGHDVTVITPDPAFPKGETPANLREIDVHNESYKKWEPFYEVTSTGDNDLNLQMRIGFHAMVELVEVQMKNDKVQKIIKEEKFDLLMLEACVKPALLLTHVVKAPVIQVSSFGPFNSNIGIMGSAWHPTIQPDMMSKRLYNLTMWEKVVELWNKYKLENIMQEIEDEENELSRKLFGPNAPAISELKNKVDMLFLNIHPIFEGNRPVPPSVIYMGGIHQKPVKELPTDLKTYLDSSKNGVIYISFGTNVIVSLFPPDRIRLMVKVFSELPYDVLWKWDQDELQGRSKNIRISKWLPQSDLLSVPLIGVPMLADQWYNVEKYVYHKIGVKLDFLSMTEEEFKNAITTAIEDKSYLHNIVRLGNLMRDQPQPPLERAAVWWTEHVLRHGGARHLRAPTANISWAEYLELELVCVMLAAFLTFVSVLLYVVFTLWKYFRRGQVYDKLKEN